MGKAIGIDLGTTNSCAATMAGGKPRVLTYTGGETTIPSVFAIDEKGNRLVGSEAKQQAQLNPTNTVMASKRLIGRNFHSKSIDKVKQVFTYEMLEGENNEVLIKVKDQVFTLDQISAAILRKIKEVAEEALDAEVDQAVITVPAYFNDRQRQAVRNAGRLSGLKVLRVLNEPTAAALAYGLGKNLSQRIAVYDLGGGTFDISVIDIKDRIFEVIATGGDTFLGGVDFDDRLMRFVLERFLDEHGIDLAWDRVASSGSGTRQDGQDRVVQRPEDTHPHSLHRQGRRRTARYRDGPQPGATRTVHRRTRRPDRTDLRPHLQGGGHHPEQVDEVLLVGGQSRMPLVQRKITDFMGKPPSKGVHPDEAVAIGAAIMAHSLSSASGGDVTLLDVLPMAIGINKVDGSMHVLFQKNQPLPDYKTRTLTTSKDNQRSIMLRIYQGESRKVVDNELLGTFVFSGIRPAEKGSVQVEVTFHIDSEGILNLTARDKDTGQTVESTLKLGAKKKKKKKKAEKTAAAAAATTTAESPAPAAPPVAPTPFTMPSSSLMQDIGGGSALPPSSGPAAPAPAAAGMRPAGESTDDAPTRADDAASASSTPKDAPPATARAGEDAPSGFFGGIAAWFKSLFGG